MNLFLRGSAVVIAILSIAVATPASAANNGAQFSQPEALAISQAVLGQAVGNYTFLTPAGQPLALHEFKGKPTVISLIYTSCFHVCPMITQHLADVAGVAREAFGDDSFTVVTIGFDTAVDTPERMGEYAAERGLDRPGWQFLSADAETIQALSTDLGFIFYPSAKGFDHLAQTTVLDSEGRVYRQVYGQQFATPMLVEPLKELIYGESRNGSLIQSFLDDVRLFCTIYDPTTGRYKFDYSIFMMIFVGVLCLGGVAIVIIRSWREAV